MAPKERRRLGNKYPSLFLTILILLLCVKVNSQTYNPSLHTVTNKAIGYGQATPGDARSMYYDALNFVYRPYQSVVEVKTYLNLPKYRYGNFIIVVDSGGILQPNGVYVGGHNTFWMFKDSTADANLVELNLQGSTGSCAGCLLAPNNLSDLTNANTARANLGLGAMALLGTTAGGDLSGTFPNPTVARFNGLLPSYYLNYNNLNNLPAIPPQLSPTGAGLVSITGVYPSLTFTGRTPGIEETIFANNALSRSDSLNMGAFIFTFQGTGAIVLPSGTTAQRPSSPAPYMIRGNPDSLGIEFWNGSAWKLLGTGSGGGGGGITALTGDVSASGTGSVVATLATVNPNPFVPNTFLKFGVNGKGLVTSATAVVSGDIIIALGFTPYNATNPAGYISLSSLSASLPILYNSSTGNISLSTPNTVNKYLNGYGNFVTLNTDSITEGSTNLFFTNARARTAISLTTTGTSGAATYNNSTGVLNIPNYAVTSGTVTSVALSTPSFLTTAGSPITTSGTFTVTLATQTANTVFGNHTGSTAAPTFGKVVLADQATNTANYIQGWDGSGNPTALAPDTLFVKNRVSGTGVQVGNISSDTLYLNNLVAGANVTLTKNADSSITIAATGGGGGGITSLNSQTGATQTFVHNISGGTGSTFTISSSANVHNFNTPVYYDYGSRTIPGSLNVFWGAGVGSTAITTGQYNTGFGSNVLSNITSGMYNTAFGTGVLNGTQRGMGNVGMGWLALALCDSCMQETAIGGGALSGDTAGRRNCAFGYGAGDFMSFGIDNILVGNQAAQVARLSSYNVMIGSNVSANVDGDSTNIMIGYHNNYTNHRISKRSILLGDLVGNTFNVNFDSVIAIGSSITTTADTLLKNTILIGNFLLSSRSNFADFGTKTQLIQLGNGGGNTTVMNSFTPVGSDIFFNTDSVTTGSGYCVWNASQSKWFNLGRAASGTTINTTNSVTGDGSSGTPVKLVNDAATPGNSMYYGTNSSGTKGFFALPSSSTVAMSSITAATTTNSIDNVNNTQTWNWNSLSGAALQLYSNSTAAAGNGQIQLDILMQGANANSGQTTYGINVQNLHSGSSPVNVGMHIKTSGAGTNYSLITEGGFTGLGTLTPTVNLDVSGTASGIIYAEETNSGGFSEFSGRTHNGTGQFELYALPSTYSGTTGGFTAGSSYMRFTGANGGGLAAQFSNGVLRFFTGGEALANERMRIDSIGRIHIDTLTGVSKFNIGGSFSDNNPGLRGYLTTFEKGIFTDNNTAASGTVTLISANSFMGGTVAAFHTSVTYTNAATVYIDSALKSYTNATITNPWALYVNTGKTHFGGALQIVDGTQSNGFVLTSDANGNASWQSAGSSTNIYNTDGTLTANRTVSGGGFSLAFGTIGSSFSSVTAYATNSWNFRTTASGTFTIGGDGQTHSISLNSQDYTSIVGGLANGSWNAITTGTSSTLTNTTTNTVFNPSSLMASYTLTLPSTTDLPDGFIVMIHFGGIITSGVVVTSLTISANTGQTIIQSSAPTTASAGDCIVYKFLSGGSPTWYREK